MIGKRIIYGDNIRLRPFVKKDTPHIIKRNFDPNITKWTANSDVMDARMKKLTIEHIKNLVKKKTKESKDYVIEIKTGSLWKPIGDCGLGGIKKWNRSAVFFIAIDSDYQRKGYGIETTKILLSYAFEKMLLHRIESHVAEFNKPSIDFHEKLGFTRESRQKEAVFQNSRFWDLIVYRMLKSEWDKLTG